MALWWSELKVFVMIQCYVVYFAHQPASCQKANFDKATVSVHELTTACMYCGIKQSKSLFHKADELLTIISPAYCMALLIINYDKVIWQSSLLKNSNLITLHIMQIKATVCEICKLWSALNPSFMKEMYEEEETGGGGTFLYLGMVGRFLRFWIWLGPYVMPHHDLIDPLFLKK